MRGIERLWQNLLGAIFPPRCLICNTHYAWQPSAGQLRSNGFSDVTAPYFCDACREGLTPVASPFCSKCGLPFVSHEGEGHTCSECLTEKRYFRKARAFGVYEGHLMEAIHLLKYGKKTSLSQPLGALAKETFFQFWDAHTVDFLLPVPLHIKRLRERGFNQAYLVIRKWAKREGVPFDGLMLSRSQWTEPQTNLTRSERRKNVKDAFSIRQPDEIKGQKILLVDDVFTTGATVNECARVLMRGGAESVDVLTVARAV